MGLQRKQGVPVNEGEQFDIRLTVEEFKHSVNMYTLWKPGMEIHVSHVKRRSIPIFVFPGGVRPPHPSKVTWDSKRSSELKISGHGQTKKSQEGKAVKLGTNDDRKRKQADDSVDDLRISKSPAFLPNSSREFHEDRNPVSTASACSVKCDDTEVNSMSEQNSEKPDLKSSGEYPSRDSETNGSMKSNSQVNPLLSTATAKEAEKLAIEKVMCDPYDGNQALSGESDELEDDLEYRSQVKDFGGNVKKNNLGSSNSESIVAAEPFISKKENTSSTAHLYSNGNLEELEVKILTYF